MDPVRTDIDSVALVSSDLTEVPDPHPILEGMLSTMLSVMFIVSSNDSRNRKSNCVSFQ